MRLILLSTEKQTITQYENNFEKHTYHHLIYIGQYRTTAADDNGNIPLSL